MKVEILSGVTGVAVSGGADSMTLLGLYLAAGLRPVVINVEHGIRGESSLRDSRFVAEFCEKHGLKLLYREVNAPLYAEKEGLSLELAARKLRYEFFDELLHKGEVDRIALAHHADDDTETVLMRICRGTGIRGLQGMGERDGYIRPLLNYTREEIVAYAEEHGIPYVHDETNDENSYTRNFFRNEILPKLKSRYPQLNAAIKRLTDNAAEAEEFISAHIVEPTVTPSGYVLKDLFSQPIIVQKYSINAVLSRMGLVQDVEQRHLDTVLSLQSKHNNASVNLRDGVTAGIKDGDLYFWRETGEIFLPRPFSPTENIEFRGVKYTFSPTDKTEIGVTFDRDKVADCEIRTRRDGDVFRHVNGRKKLLSDFLNDKKLTKAEKSAVLVLAKNEVIYAVLGIEVAEEAKIDETTKEILRVNKECK